MGKISASSKDEIIRKQRETINRLILSLSRVSGRLGGTNTALYWAEQHRKTLLDRITFLEKEIKQLKTKSL